MCCSRHCLPMSYRKVIEQLNLKEDLEGVSFLVSVVSNSYGTASVFFFFNSFGDADIPAGE